MSTISTCMIVLNEEKFLARCLDSIKEFSDEIIIIDTGSTDTTKDIARMYTDMVFDYKWIGNFAHARNFSFSKASMDYIYHADADEVIDQENIRKIIALKEHGLEEYDIVQMYYANQLEYGSTYNYDKEYRPKMYRRLRQFIWKDPIHEVVELEPSIFDSDISILHLPESNHASRDFSIFQKMIREGEYISPRLVVMYAKELYIAGKEEDFLEAKDFFVKRAGLILEANELKAVQCVLVRIALIEDDKHLLLKYSLKNIADGLPSAEVSYYLGEYYFCNKEYEEAIIWYYNAAYETTGELNIHYCGDYPLNRIAECYHSIGAYEQEKEYRKRANALI